MDEMDEPLVAVVDAVEVDVEFDDVLVADETSSLAWTSLSEYWHRGSLMPSPSSVGSPSSLPSDHPQTT
ncbi:unnamed protein product [Phytophthora fragariaefolia]|uniref:Unnamed protein product n=1 Tax=Phytophthora fragariaefolia TaxID=1490495 RepID=A0A9W7D6M2_9STRA|nr:unnamed protein product [Phytophthora fragariaefolia]